MAAASYRGVVKDNKVVLQKGIDLPDGLEVEVTPIDQITAYTQSDWLKQARHVREQIAEQIGGYAGDSVKEIREIREDRAKAIGEQR
jgi:hypothetical protein